MIFLSLWVTIDIESGLKGPAQWDSDVRKHFKRGSS